MKKWTKRLLIVGSLLLIFGAVIAGAGYASGAPRTITFSSEGFKLQSVGDRIELPYQKLENASKITLQVKNAEIKIIPSEENGVEMVYYSEEDKPQIAQANGELEISQKNNERVYVFGFGPSVPEAEIYLYLNKETVYELLKINSSTGDICIDGLKASSIEVSSDLGDIDCNAIEGKIVSLIADNGNVTMNQMHGEEAYVQLGLGKLEVSNTNFTQAEFNNDNGDISLNGITSSILNAQLGLGNLKAEEMVLMGGTWMNDNGDIDVSGNLTGQYMIENGLGNTRFATTADKESFAYNVQTDLGSIDIDGDKTESGVREQANGDNALTIQSDNGDVTVEFK